jgi:hypothetical protein
MVEYASFKCMKQEKSEEQKLCRYIREAKTARIQHDDSQGVPVTQHLARRAGAASRRSPTG